jgi:hypothetical protein
LKHTDPTRKLDAVALLVRHERENSVGDAVRSTPRLRITALDRREELPLEGVQQTEDECLITQATMLS